MGKKWTKVMISVASAGMLAISMLTAMPARQVKAASTTSFKQEIIVNDVTDGNHTANVKMPKITVTYRLTPVVDSAGLPANDSRYADKLDLFINGSVKDSTKVVEKSVVIEDNAASDDDGHYVKDITPDEIGLTGFENASRVYRYKIEISGVYRGDDTQDDAHNLLKLSQHDFTFPENQLGILDVSVDTDKKVAAIAFWNSTGTNKLVGFTGTEGDGADAFKYNVADLQISSDYIGKNWDSLHGGFVYTVKIDKLPSDTFKQAKDVTDCLYDDGRSWGESTENPFNGGESTSSITLEGTLDQNSQILIGGLPKGVTYLGSIDFSRLENAVVGNTTKDLRAKYGPAIFFGAKVKRVEGINDMTSFAGSEYAGKYKYDAYVTGEDTRALDSASEVVLENNGDSNSSRFIIFDPSDLVVVGVVRNTLPAVGLICIAGAIAIALFFTRKKKLPVIE